MATLHIQRADAIRDIASLLDRVETGEEIVIDGPTAPVAVLRPASKGPNRLLSETLRILEERRSLATLDSSFSRDLEAVIASHEQDQIDTVWGQSSTQVW
jgi:antitoxin (DNA-binding transcriptional repressor) of toxin-antitoxin stability system